MALTGIRYYRAMKRLTQAHVAESLGIDAGRMSRIEAGELIPTSDEVDALVALLEIPPTYLFSRHVLAEIAERAQAGSA